MAASRSGVGDESYRMTSSVAALARQARQAVNLVNLLMAHRYPESALFYRRLDRGFPLAVRGEGVWLVDETGRRYLAACGGAMVAVAGHGVVEIAERIAAGSGE